MAYALRPNAALSMLNLTHADIGEKGTMVMANLLLENKRLTLIKLDDEAA